MLKAVAVEHELHPLALEDVFTVNTSARSKADYYPRHLFLNIQAHSLHHDADTKAFNPHDQIKWNREGTRPNFWSRMRMKQAAWSKDAEAASINSVEDRPRKVKPDDGQGPSAASLVIKTLTEEYRVKLRSDSIGLFLLHDGQCLLRWVSRKGVDG